MTVASETTRPHDPRASLRPSRRLAAARIAALGLCGLISFLYLYRIPSYYLYIRDTCPSGSCAHSVLSAVPAGLLAEAGLSFANAAAAYTAVALLNLVVYLCAAILVFAKRPRDPVALLAGVAFVAFPASYFFSGLWRDTGWIVTGMEYASFLLLVLFLLLFPNGRIANRPLFAAVLALVGLRLAADQLPSGPWKLSQWPVGLSLTWMALLYGTLLVYPLVRYRCKSSATEKQQTKWFLYGLSLCFSGIVFVSVAPMLVRSDFYSNANPFWLLALDITVLLLFWLIPITLTISMLRKRLWDIDPIMNRTIVYGALSAAIVVLYSLTVWYLSFLFQTGNNMIFSLLATGVTAFLFAPLKERLQRLVNRLMYGELHDPYTVLLDLGNRLKEPLAPEAVLETVSRTVRETLRVPYAGIVLFRHDKQELVASAGAPPAETTSFPLIVGGMEIGALLIATRSPGETFNEAENKLLSILSRQAGSILQSVRQALDIRLLTAELQRSREQLVRAREEERRAMRNNLHDDIAPRLAAMKLTASLMEDWIGKDPAQAVEMVKRFKGDIGQTVEDIRGIVYDLRPPALDELGLIGAIRQRAGHLQDAAAARTGPYDVPLNITLEVPDTLPPLPAAIEVGAYRIVTEALVNVVRHSQASCCRVVLHYDDAQRQLRLRVEDNGIGFHDREPAAEPRAGSAQRGTEHQEGLAEREMVRRAETPERGTAASAAARKGGLGLPSMRERAEELGGSCRVGTAPAGGALVTAVLPVRDLATKGVYDDPFENIARR